MQDSKQDGKRQLTAADLPKTYGICYPIEALCVPLFHHINQVRHFGHFCISSVLQQISHDHPVVLCQQNLVTDIARKYFPIRGPDSGT